MKTLLRLLGAGILTTVATTSLIACCECPGTAMNAKVSADFGFVNTSGVSTVEVTVNFTANTASWTSLQLSNITAAKLLAGGNEPTPKAVSIDAGDF